MRGLSAKQQQHYLDMARERGAKIAEYRPVLTDETPAEIKKSEKAFQRAVIKEARNAGWRHYAAGDSRMCVIGWPDLTLVRTLPGASKGRIIMAELKTDKGKLEPAQEEWLTELRATGCVEVYTWRPKDWPDILRILA